MRLVRGGDLEEHWQARLLADYLMNLCLLLLLIVLVLSPRLISVAEKSEVSAMIVFSVFELLIWMSFSLFARYCASVKRVSRNIPFKIGPFIIWLLVVLGGLLNLICLCIFYHAQRGTLGFRIIMFILAGGFIVRMCLGLTVSVFYKGGRS